MIKLVAAWIVLAATVPTTATGPSSAPGLNFAYTPPDAPLRLERLRVCADPNNLPFSNRAKEGFENRLAGLVANELGLPLDFIWMPQRRGFIRNGLQADACDLVMGVPTGMDRLTATRPYYRSTYVFLSRANDNPDVASLDDPVLRNIDVGVHAVGDDYTNTPGAHALAKRGIIDNIVGISIYGDYSEPNPPARLVEAVAHGDVDVAIIWGPFAGYFAPRQETPLVFEPVTPSFDPPAQAFVYSVSMGVKRGNYALRKRLSEIIETRRDDIHQMLASYGVPLVDTSTSERAEGEQE